MSQKILFALAILNNLLIYKIDIISAFTHGDIDTKIYLNPPKGYNNLFISNFNLDNNSDSILLLLNKALYGLKQLARIWHYTLIKVLKDLGYIALLNESCIYYNKILSIYIYIYVDDLAIIGPNKESI